MKPIWITQRVTHEARYQESRDALDNAWIKLLLEAGYFVQLVPNNVEWLQLALKQALPCAGILLTGGNDLASVGGDAPHRDQLETALLHYALSENLPVLGVCRGMQLIASEFGAELIAVEHQVQPQQTNIIEGEPRAVNSYHQWALAQVPNDFRVTAWDEKYQVIKGIQHLTQPIFGVMWHPERIVPFSKYDIGFIQRVFS